MHSITAHARWVRVVLVLVLVYVVGYGGLRASGVLTRTGVFYNLVLGSRGRPWLHAPDAGWKWQRISVQPVTMGCARGTHPIDRLFGPLAFVEMQLHETFGVSPSGPTHCPQCRRRALSGLSAGLYTAIALWAASGSCRGG